VQETKRSVQRQGLQIPLCFRILSNGDGPDWGHLSRTMDISMSGLFMPSPIQLQVGSKLALSLRIPTETSGSHRCFVHCKGCVVHERHLADGQLGYGVQFEEPLSFRQIRSQPFAGPEPTPLSHLPPLTPGRD